MDLLFKRYASPFDYLDTLLEYGEFGRGILNIWKTAQEEKAWEFYLSNNPYNKKSFEDWSKEEFTKQQNNKPMSKVEVDATVKKSQDILKNFKIPN